jgi:hypothetical protein
MGLDALNDAHSGGRVGRGEGVRGAHCRASGGSGAWEGFVGGPARERKGARGPRLAAAGLAAMGPAERTFFLFIQIFKLT